MLIQAIGTAMAGDPNKLSHTKAMRNYLYDYEVPPDLARVYFTCRFPAGQKNAPGPYIEPEVDLCIETLSKPLRRRLVLHTRRDLVERVPWFSRATHEVRRRRVPSAQVGRRVALEVVGRRACPPRRWSL